MNKKFFGSFAHTFATFAVKKIFNVDSLLLYIISICITTTATLNGQSENLTENIIEIAEDLASDDSDPEAVSIYIERLNELTENQVKINSSDPDEISRLFFLSDFQVKALTDYIHTSGKILSVYELAAIPGFDKETVEMVTPFITLEIKTVNNQDFVRWKNLMISNFSIKSSKNDTSSLGSQWKILTKYKFTSGGFSGGFTTEKDPGEKLLSGNPPMPDFLSAYISFTGTGHVKKIIVGDYSTRFGQGTNINTGIRRGLSLTTPGYMSANDEIKPYTSTEENKFFRGIAAEFSVKNLDLLLFFSKNDVDAKITSSTGSQNYHIENFYLEGVHNTPSLLQKKDAVSEQACGISLSYNFTNLKVGLVWSENKLSLPFIPTVNDPGKIFDFTGTSNNLYSVYYNSIIKKILLYGELSSGENNKYAIIQGISFRPSDRLAINFLFRNYTPGYTAFYGQGPGSGSKTTNEKGCLGNFNFEAARHLFISGGCEVQHFPWLKYRCSSPSMGIRKELKARFLPSDNLAIDASYDYRLSMADNTETPGIAKQEKIVTRSYKVSARYSVNNNLVLGARLDYKIAYPEGGRGIILFQEISYSFSKIPVTLWGRYCLFNTDSWASRIYTYENDMLYSLSIPALSGEGSRFYFMAKWKISDIAEVRIKYGITSMFTNGIPLENKDELKMQFRIRF